MNVKQFKPEFRLICSDVWGDALDAWFECAAHLWWNGVPIPSEWEYSPGMVSDPRNEDSYWYNEFDCNTSTEDLVLIGEFLFRYCQMLKHFKKDY